MSFPQKTKEIVIKGNSYTVTYPNNRQFIAIYSRKAQLTKEQYDALNFSLDGSARFAAALTDATATLEVILPENFFQDLNIKSIVEADLTIAAELVKVYQDQVVSWFNEWEKAIAEIVNPKKEETANV